jgi:chemotaxis protein MotB
MRKKKHEEHESSERWLVSYSDFITLLMVMFVVLYSMGQVDVKKYQQLADSMRAAFAGGSPIKIVDPQINSESGGNEDSVPNPITIPGIPQKPAESQEVASELTTMLKEMDLGNAVSVQTNIEGVLISLSEKLVFTSGTAELNAEAYPVLNTIAKMVAHIENQIRIVGHTDTTPPIDPKYANNWDLSVGRAIVITDYLIAKGISPDRLMVSGRGEYQPIFLNDTPEHRSLNSRADVVIIYKSSSEKIIDPEAVIAQPQTGMLPTELPVTSPSSGGSH